MNWKTFILQGLMTIITSAVIAIAGFAWATYGKIERGLWVVENLVNDMGEAKKEIVDVKERVQRIEFKVKSDRVVGIIERE